MRKLGLAYALLVSVSTQALAGTGTITVKDSTGATQTYTVITNGSGFFGPMVGGRLNPAAKATAAQVSGPPGTPWVATMVE